MATEDSNNPPEPVPAPAVLTPSTLPDYPQMIMAAIESLNESEGSNKTSINQQIESTHGDLPADHAELLIQHLNQMKQSGVLVFAKNNYMKSDPNAPPKRGRGRPPKPKVPGAEAAASAVSSPPRPRGRPPKPKDPFFPAPIAKSSTTTSSGSGRPRGRPPKKAKTSPTSTPATATAPTATGAPRGRGRPPKVKPSVAPVGC